MTESYIIYKLKLKGEYREVFEKIDIYMGTANIDSVSKEELMHSLVDNFLAAQEEGKPVEKITGKNIERFCREICSGFGFKEHLISFVERIKPMIYLMFFLSLTLIDIGDNSSFNYFNCQIGIDIALGYLTGFLIACFVDLAADKILKTIIFKKKKVTIRFSMLIHLALTLALISIILTVCIFLENGSSEIGGDLSMPLWIIHLFLIILMVTAHILTRKIRKEYISQNLDLADLYSNQDVINTIANIEKKKYQKRNKKLIKKGKAPLTKEEFIDEEIKKSKRTLKPTFYIFAVLITLILLNVIATFDGFIDMLIYNAIMLPLESIIIYFCYRSEKNVALNRIAWLEKEKSGIKEEKE